MEQDDEFLDQIIAQIQKQGLKEELDDGLVRTQLQKGLEKCHVSLKSLGEVNETRQSASANLPNSESISPPEKRKFERELQFETRSLSKRMEVIAF